jgi:hypothetical protein
MSTLKPNNPSSAPGFDAAEAVFLLQHNLPALTFETLIEGLEFTPDAPLAKAVAQEIVARFPSLSSEEQEHVMRLADRAPKSWGEVLSQKLHETLDAEPGFRAELLHIANDARENPDHISEPSLMLHKVILGPAKALDTTLDVDAMEAPLDLTTDAGRADLARRLATLWAWGSIAHGLASGEPVAALLAKFPVEAKWASQSLRWFDGPGEMSPEARRAELLLEATGVIEHYTQVLTELVKG